MAIAQQIKTATSDELLSQRAILNRQQPDQKPQDTDTPGFIETTLLSGLHNSFLGSISKRLNVEAAGAFREPEPDFDPMEHFTQENIQRNPGMQELFDSGIAFDADNQFEFWAMVHNANVTQRDRRRLSQGSVLAQFAGPLSADALLAAAAGPSPSSNSAMKLTQWLKRGNLATRTAKMSAIGAGGNVAYEAAIGAMDPTDETEARDMLNAASIGAAFGAVLPTTGAAFRRGFGKIGDIPVPAKLTETKFVPTAIQRRMQKEMGQGLVQRVPQQAKDVIDNDRQMLQSLLDETPDTDRAIEVVRHPETESLIDQVRQHYANNGRRIEINQSGDQETVDLALSLDEMDAASQNMAKPENLREAFGNLLGSITPGGRLRRSASNEVRDVFRVLFDDHFQTFQTRADPINTVNGPSAETLSRSITNLKNNTRMALDESYANHFRNGGKRFIAELSSGERVSVGRWMNRRQFGVVVKDYINQADEIRRGKRQDFSFDAPASVKEAASAHTEFTKRMLEELEDAGLFRGPKALQRLKDDLNELDQQIGETENLIRQEQEGELPFDVDEDDPSIFDPGLRGVTKRDAQKTIDDRIQGEPDAVDAYEQAVNARQAEAGMPNSSTLFPDERLQDGTSIAVTPETWRGTPTSDKQRIRQNARRRGMSIIVNEDLAEEARDIVGDRTIDQALDALNRGKVAKRDEFVAQVLKKPDNFHPEIAHAAKRLDIEGRLPAQRKPTMEDHLAALREKRQNLEAEIADVQTKVDAADTYVTQRWLTDQIRTRRPEFIALLRQQFHDNRIIDYNTGVEIPMEDRPIITEAIDRLSDDDVATIREFDNEADLFQNNREVFERYNNAVDDYIDAAARATADTFTAGDNLHGVTTAAAGANPLKGRLLQIDPGRFNSFLDNDLHRLLDFYNQAVAGKVGLRKAVGLNQDRVNNMLDRTLGKRIGRFDPELDRPLEVTDIDENMLLEGLTADFQKKADAAAIIDRNTGSNLSELIERSRSSFDKVMSIAVPELLGRQPIPTTATGVGWRALGRTLLRMPLLAYGGGFAVSSIPDVSMVTFLTGRQTPQAVGDVMNLTFRNFGRHQRVGQIPRWGLEAIEATADEAATQRAMAMFDIDNMPMDPRMTTNPIARGVSRVDQATDTLTRHAMSLSGMNWWNRHWRRISAHMLTRDTILGLHRMVRLKNIPGANEAIRAGGDQAADVLRQAGFENIEQLRRLNRLGFTPDRAERINRLMRQHATDIEGNPLRNLSFDDFGKHKGLFIPNYEQWWRQDKEMFEIFTSAIDHEVRAIIAEPNILSRPLINRTMMGRMFNQFWGFAMAWGNQTAPVAGQHTSRQFAGFVSTLVGLGALTDGIKAHLSGQRSFEDTAELWQERPIAMMQNAINRSGAISWLSRPIEVLNRTPYSIPSLLGEDSVQSTTHTGRAINLPGIIGGPTFDILDRFGKGVLNPLATGQGYSLRDIHTMRTLMPFQNNVFLRSIYRFSSDAGIDNPFGEGKGIDLFPVPTQPAYDARRPARQPTP